MILSVTIKIKMSKPDKKDDLSLFLTESAVDLASIIFPRFAHVSNCDSGIAISYKFPNILAEQVV